ncbi:MAG: FCD domain-containing protein [Oscillospiraceae bacterium]|nr:FCD domain-containing protein [Oscillospiraceae bacterium]
MRLKDLVYKEQQRQSISDVMSLLDGSLDEHLRNVLVARKIVEPEMAALAAQNAKEENLVAIRRVLEEMDRLTAEGKSMAPTDEPFHTEIARASGNPIIESILKIARTDQDHSPEIEYIISSSVRKVPSDHWSIYKAIEEHNPEKAKKIMIRHIENIIQKLDEYEKNNQANGES